MATAFAVFLVEGEKLLNRSISGVPVLGSTRMLGPSIHAHDINLVFLCSAELKDLSEMIEAASHFEVTVQFLPSVHDLLSDKVRVSKNVSVGLAAQRAQAARADYLRGD